MKGLYKNQHILASISDHPVTALSQMSGCGEKK